MVRVDLEVDSESDGILFPNKVENSKGFLHKIPAYIYTGLQFFQEQTLSHV